METSEGAPYGSCSYPRFDTGMRDNFHRVEARLGKSTRRRPPAPHQQRGAEPNEGAAELCKGEVRTTLWVTALPVGRARWLARLFFPPTP